MGIGKYVHLHLSQCTGRAPDGQATARQGRKDPASRCNSYNPVGHSDLSRGSSGATLRRTVAIPANVRSTCAPDAAPVMPVLPEPDPPVAPNATPLSHGDARFRLLVERVRDYAIVLLDADGIIRSWNAGLEAIVGYGADEAIGRPSTIFYDDEAVQRGAPAYELRSVAS